MRFKLKDDGKTYDAVPAEGGLCQTVDGRACASYDSGECRNMFASACVHGKYRNCVFVEVVDVPSNRT